ncbi:MAG TPA: hypothetical protein VGM07_13130 [Stellaceae bacterium]|jgi:hypothetical protein
MPTAPKNVDDIDIGRVFFDLENPRHEPFKTEEQVIEYLCDREEVYPLARDIARHGLNPLERLALIPIKAKGGRITGYTMAEGNRRLCAIKLLGDPERAPANLRKAFEQIARDYDYIPITKVAGVVFDNKDDATVWLERVHGGAQAGIGRKTWNAEQKQRFSGTSKNRIAQLFLDYAQDKGMMTAEQRKRRLTTVQRFLGNSIFKEVIGIDESDPEQLSRTRPAADFDIIARRFVRDLVEGKANSRMNRAEIIQYARPLSSISCVTTVRVPAEALTSGPAPRPARRTHPGRPARVRHVQFEEEISAALKTYGNEKLQSLYHSICNIDLDPHTPIVAIGVWAFFETLTACAGRHDATAFGAFLGNAKLAAYGMTGDRGAIRSALDRVRDYGNITKHHSIAGTFNGDQLNNDMILLKILVIRCIEEAESKKS